MAKTRSFWCFGRARKINLIDLIKRGRQGFEVFFLKIPPPLEKILDPHLFKGVLLHVEYLPLSKITTRYSTYLFASD